MEKLPQDPFTGEITSAFVGRAEDDLIYKNSQSGGIVTALLAHLFDSGEITGAVVAVMKRGNPPSGEPLIIRSPQELPETQKSKYIPIPLLKVVPGILQEEDRFALVGLPCHIHGLHNLYSLYPALEQKIAVTIGLVCDRVLSLAVLDYFARRVSCSSLASLVFRDKQRPCYPGNVVVESQDGPVSVLDSSERISAKDFFTPARCRLCFDKLNVLTDIVVGDPHGISGINRTEGESLVLLRTPKGKEILSQAQRKRVVSVREIRSEDAIAGQGIEKKRQEWNAYTALWKKKGLPLPNYTVLVMPDSHTAPQQTERQSKGNLQLAFALDSYSSRAEVVDAALSWLRKKKLKGYIALPYRLFRRAAGGFARKIKNTFRG
jgi:coenzyme F420 hydrogenase subunit beta